MRKYLIWETEYQDEGSSLFEAESENAAIQQWLADTGVNPEDAPGFECQEATPAMLEVHEASDVLEEAQERLARALVALREEMKATRSGR